MMADSCEFHAAAASPLTKPVNDDHNQDLTSRTSHTFADSWDIYTEGHDDAGVDVPDLLRPFFGIDFLPFWQDRDAPLPEEEIQVPPMDIPQSVEISSEEPEQQKASDGESSAHSLHRNLSAAAPQDTAELQEMLIQSGKKKKPGRRLKAAAHAVLKRMKRGGKTSSARDWSKQSSNSRPQSKKNLLSLGTTASVQGHNNGSWLSPTATEATAIVSPLSCDAGVNEAEIRIQSQTQCLRDRAETQEKQMRSTHAEIEGLQSQLSLSISKYQEQLAQLQATQEQLAQLALGTKQTKEVSNAEKAARVLKRSESGTFMRVHDLDLGGSLRGSEELESLSSLSHSGHGALKVTQVGVPTSEFLLMDHYLLEIIHQLTGLGFDLATDETDRFAPTRDTSKLLSKMPSSAKTVQNGWPVQPWTPAWDDNVLVWTGRVNHDGFGHTWPVVKGRTILHTSAEKVLEYMWDSSLVRKYNPLCQGREDLYTLQNDVNTTEKESPFGFAGCAKIVRSLNKHRLVPKALEMKILMYAQPLKQHDGSFILVSRSVWENDSATLDSQAAKSVIRTEMLLGCSIMRAIDKNTCELTQMTHVHSPGVPEVLARKLTPGQCQSLMKTLQGLFHN